MSRRSTRPPTRAAWRPLVGSDDGAIGGSRFGGTPYLLEGERWPRCGQCDRPMQLFLQLELATLPNESRSALGAGILQLFYCTSLAPHCEVECEAWKASPPARSVLARRVHPSVASDRTRLELTLERPSAELPSQRILGWERFDDVSADADDDGSNDGSDGSGGGGGGGGGVDDGDDDGDVGAPATGDKLGGSPYWVQAVEYPACVDCGARMELVFQLDSDDHLAYAFGDVGCGHLTMCPTHRDRLAFGWACC